MVIRQQQLPFRRHDAQTIIPPDLREKPRSRLTFMFLNVRFFNWPMSAMGTMLPPNSLLSFAHPSCFGVFAVDVEFRPQLQ